MSAYGKVFEEVEDYAEENSLIKVIQWKIGP